MLKWLRNYFRMKVCSKVPVANSVSAINCRFSYSDKKVGFKIADISIDLPAGKISALIGPSGSGKTTLGLLLTGLLQPVAGQVVIDGLEARKYVADHPGRVAYLPQKPQVVSGTLAHNIALGVPDTSLDRVKLVSLIEDCQLSDLVSGFPNGLDEEISEFNLSVGQIQRIGLARALYTSPTFLLLDEPTSALDADTEDAISLTLGHLNGICTVLVIAHRLATISNLDNIFLIEDGKVTANGSFGFLKKTSRLVERQAELLGMLPPN